MRRVAAVRNSLLAVVCCCLVAPALAGGGSSAPTPAPTDSEPPEIVARRHFNDGLAARDRAWKLEERLANGELSGAKADKARARARSQYERAARAYREAIELAPRMHEAHGSLGYALRKLGDYEAALESYNTAISIDPNYAEALEYRAEAYLGLGRIQLAKTTWEQLTKLDRARADELLEAMRSWIAHQRDGGGVDARAVDELDAWVAERSTPGGHATAPGSRKHASW